MLASVESELSRGSKDRGRHQLRDRLSRTGSEAPNNACLVPFSRAHNKSLVEFYYGA